MTESLITTIQKHLLAESSGTLHLWHNGRKACGGRSHVGGVMSLNSHDFAKSEPEHRCKRCAARFAHLKSKFPNYGKPKVAEDAAGLSSDGVATNSAGGGQVDGIGIGTRGEPGGRKRRSDARRKNPKLFAALRRGGTVEMEDYEEETRDPVVNTAPTIADDPLKERLFPSLKKRKAPAKKSLKRGDAEIVVDPELPHRYEDTVDEDRPGGMVRIDLLIRLGLGDVKKINYYRQAIRDPESAVKNPTLRPYVGEVLEQTLDLIFRDAQLYNRFRTLLQKQDRTRGENELPESEAERFRRWRATSGYAIDEAFASLSNAELAHQASSCSDPSRKARMFQELRRRTGKTDSRP